MSAVSPSLEAIATDHYVRQIAVPLDVSSKAYAVLRPRMNTAQCIAADMRLIDADTGRLVPIERAKMGMSVLGVIGDANIVRAPICAVHSAGTRPVIRLTTRTGKTIAGTATHPLLTSSGWRTLGQLMGNELIATARRLPSHGTEREDRFDLCRLLGYFCGNGTCLDHCSVGLIIPDDSAFADAVAIIRHRWPEISVVEKPTGYHDASFSRVYENGWGKPFGNPLREWLRDMQLHGARDCQKHVPQWVFEAGVGGAANFLAGYLATDGCVKKSKGRWTIQFDTTSNRLAQDVPALLLRIGVIAGISKPYMCTKSVRPLFRITLSSSAENLRRFAEQVHVPGCRGQKLRSMLAELPSGRCNSFYDGLPIAVSYYAERATGRRDQKKRMRRHVCAALSERTGDAVLRHWAESDLLWEDVRALEPAGEQMVWDITLPAVHAYLAEGIVVHSSTISEPNVAPIAAYPPAIHLN